MSYRAAHAQIGLIIRAERFVLPLAEQTNSHRADCVAIAVAESGALRVARALIRADAARARSLQVRQGHANIPRPAVRISGASIANVATRITVRPTAFFRG